MSENAKILISKDLIDYCIDPSDIDRLEKLDLKECRQILPFLTRIWTRSTSCQDEPEYCDFKMFVLDKLNQFEDTNRLITYLNVDFNQIYEDVIRHLSARKKSQTISVYTCIEFESASPVAKLLMISNILLNGNIRTEENIICKYSSIDYSLFDTEIYFQDLSDLMCIIHAELGEVISLSQFVYTLLHTQSNLCVNYILNLIANSIDSLFQIVDILLDGCCCSQIDILRHKCLMAITNIWPSLSSYIIYESIRRHILPVTILNLARQENLIQVLLTIFQFEFDRNWFVQFLRSPNKNMIEKQAVDQIREELVASCYKTNYEKHLDLQLFKLYSGLRMFAGLKFNEAELKALVDLILNTDEITVAICFLLIYPPLYETETNSYRIVQWIKDKFNQAQQSILLIAVYCSSYQLHLLNEYVSNMIGFRFQLKSNSLTSIKNLFQQVFPDDSLFTEYTRSLPITLKLNAKMSQLAQISSSSTSSNTLGIYFLNQCIKTNSFINRRHFDLSDWLIDQIQECSEPIHPVMINLVNNYVIQLFNLNVLHEYRLQALNHNKILKFFKENYSNYDSNITPKLILYYYLLTYESKRRETVLSILSVIQNPSNQANNAVSLAIAAALNSSSSSANNTKLIPTSLESLITYKYPVEIFNYIPINYFLTRAKEPEFAIIYPSLLKLSINIFTQLCQVEHCLYEPILRTNSKNNVSDKLKNLNYVIEKLKEFKSQAEKNDLTRSDAHMLKILWFKAYSLHGRKLSLKTAALILDFPNLTYDEIYSNPLMLLKSENLQIYKCGPLFEIIIYILKECLLANKNQMEFFLVENHLIVLNESKVNQINQIKTLKERQELKNSLIAAQDTAVIQILLDLYLLIKQKSNELAAREVQCIICSFIHQMFIDNMNLAELVHFQGYPKELLPILVRGVPSMHICLDFVPKLLAHSELDKQIFGINLAAELCEKYPIIRTYNVAKLAVNVIFTILQSQPIDERKKFLSQVSQAIVTFYTKLPPLTQECMSLITNAIQTKTIDVDSLPPLTNYEF